MPYGYTSFTLLQGTLLQRLQDTYSTYTSSTGSGFVTPTEAGVYITEALRVLNALCAIWNADYVITFATTDQWRSLNVGGSPRVRTVTDTLLMNQMEYMLLEPPSGNTWSGSTQFNAADLGQALQYRRDELLQLSGANVVSYQTPSPTSGMRTALPDTVLNLRRVRWIPVILYSPYALSREDRVAFNAYGDYLNVTPGEPDSWAITADPPLFFDCSCPPSVGGTWDLLAFESGANLLQAGESTVIGLPDDWCWLAMYGALADVLMNSPEGTDVARGKYCLDRYMRGRKAMKELPWLLSATVFGLPVDTPSYLEMDAYAQNWENLWPWGDPQIVIGGVDLISLAPLAGNSGFGGLPVSGILTVVGNAPVPINGMDAIQLSRDGVDAVLAYAQHIAMFKCGGAEFLATMPLLDQFERYCASENSRFAALGIQRTKMIHEGSRADDLDPRYEEANAS